jgi:hypothetical protein
VWVASPYRHPCPPIAREQAVGRLGALTPGGINGKVLCGIARPAIEQSLDRAPHQFFACERQHGGIRELEQKQAARKCEQPVVDGRWWLLASDISL